MHARCKQTWTTWLNPPTQPQPGGAAGEELTLIWLPAVFGRFSFGFLLLGGPLGLPLHSKYFQNFLRCGCPTKQAYCSPGSWGKAVRCWRSPRPAFLASSFVFKRQFEQDRNSKVLDTVDFFYNPCTLIFCGLLFFWVVHQIKRF